MTTGRGRALRGKLMGRVICFNDMPFLPQLLFSVQVVSWMLVVINTKSAGRRIWGWPSPLRGQALIRSNASPCSG